MKEDTKNIFKFLINLFFLKEGFNINVFLFVNRMIVDSQSLPSQLRNHYPLHKILFTTVKALLMNELEIVYLSLYLDKMGWTTEGYTLNDNLLITGISVKVNIKLNMF
jgi:hypothetical protein